jgi:hypothetical protein
MYAVAAVVVLDIDFDRLLLDAGGRIIKRLKFTGCLRSMSDRPCAIHSVQARVKESPVLWTMTALWTQDHHALHPLSIFFLGIVDGACILALHGLYCECIDGLLIAVRNRLDVRVDIKARSVLSRQLANHQLFWILLGWLRSLRSRKFTLLERQGHLYRRVDVTLPSTSSLSLKHWRSIELLYLQLQRIYLQIQMQCLMRHLLSFSRWRSIFKISLFCTLKHHPEILGALIEGHLSNFIDISILASLRVMLFIICNWWLLSLKQSILELTSLLSVEVGCSI